MHEHQKLTAAFQKTFFYINQQTQVARWLLRILFFFAAQLGLNVLNFKAKPSKKQFLSTGYVLLTFPDIFFDTKWNQFIPNSGSKFKSIGDIMCMWKKKFNCGLENNCTSETSYIIKTIIMSQHPVLTKILLRHTGLYNHDNDQMILLNV